MQVTDNQRHSNVVNFEAYRKRKQFEAVVVQSVVDIDAWYHTTEIEADKAKTTRN